GRRALVGLELHPGADGADVALFEELGVGQGDREGADVGSLGTGADGGAEAGGVAAGGTALKAGRGLGGEAQGGAAGGGEGRGGAGALAIGGREVGARLLMSAGGWVEGEVGLVELDVDRAVVKRGAFYELRQGIGLGGGLGAYRVHGDRRSD